MQWRRVEPVQEVAALIMTGPRAAERLVSAIGPRGRAFASLETVHGEDWAAIFAAPLSDATGCTDPVLPRAPGSIALYRVTDGWWLPVGVALDAPAHAQAAMWLALGLEAAPPAILAPRFEGGARTTQEADVFPIRGVQPLCDLAFQIGVGSAA